MKFIIPILLINFICSDMSEKNPQPSLAYLVRKPTINSPKPPLLILLHGVGSNEKNMFAYADILPDKFLIVSARGPLTFGPNRFAWFQVDFSSGKPVINEQQAEQARKDIIQFIDDLQKVENFDENEVYLMGFSQGGIMSYSVALTEPKKIKGFAVMSSRLLPEVKPLIKENSELHNLKIFISHGKQDDVLNYQYALDAVKFLKEKGLKPEFHSYNESHTINQEMLNDVIEWLK